ncbi:MAG: glycosyltransferase [Thermoguttaceae bacterium]|jgi:GT2 family glycosyltransferase
MQRGWQEYVRLCRRFAYHLRQHGVRPAMHRVRAYLARTGKPSSFPSLAPAGSLAAVPLASLKKSYAHFARVALDAFLTGGARLQFAESPQPKVSVLLVLHNRAELTLACLRSLPADGAMPLELILVDNGSTDQTPELLERIDGARILRNAENRGFATAVNQAAEHAAGEYLLLLNNDTQLLGDSLRVAAGFLDEHRDAGAVGGRILTLDGRLQEAGNIVWRDGSTTACGRGDDPYAPAAMYQRDVDYCSGALLMTPRALFREEGGFASVFFPAYCEDVDYCLQLWRDGWRVVYHPDISVLHYEFGSSSSSAAACKLMARQRPLLVQRHRSWLAEQHPPGSAAFPAVRARDRRKRILFLEDRVPYPWLGNGYPRAHTILEKLVSLGYAVTFYPLQFPHDTWAEVGRSISREVEVILNQGQAGLADFLAQRRGYYDLFLVSRPHNMRILRQVLASKPDVLAGAKIIYDAEALFVLREMRERESRGQHLSAGEVERQVSDEVFLAEGAYGVTCVSEAEAEQFRCRGFRCVSTLAHATETRPGAAGFSARRGMLFVGPIHDPGSPNADSVRWLLTEIMPRLRRHSDNPPKLLLAGLWCDGTMPKDLDFSCVGVLGKVADLTSLYDRVRMFVAPTRFAAGLPHKVHEAAARGLPAVVSSLLAEQLGWRHEQELLVADDPRQFAECCRRLEEDGQLWQRLRDGALAAVTRDCSPQLFDRRLAQVLEQALAASSRNGQGVAA